MAERIQLSRAKGWRKPQGAIVVSRPSRWGNPWQVGDWMTVTYGATAYGSVGHYTSTVEAHSEHYEETTITAELAVRFYRDALVTMLTPSDWENDGDRCYREELVAALEGLRGHDLACWCPLWLSDGSRAPCHADVLLDLLAHQP